MYNRIVQMSQNFIYTPNIYVKDRETVFTKTFKTFTNFVWIEVLSFTVKRLYEVQSSLVFHGISFLKIPKNFDYTVSSVIFPLNYNGPVLQVSYLTFLP